LINYKLQNILIMKDFSKKKRNLSVLPENERILGTPEHDMANKRKEITKIIKKEIKKNDKLKRNKNNR